MKTKLIIALFALCAWAVQAADITVDNYSFELPAAGKIKGWNGENGTDIPGWACDTSATDSGVETGSSDTGAYHAFLRGSDTSIYNLTSHVIAPYETYTLQVDSKSASSILSLYYDNNGTRVTMGTITNASTSSYTTYSLTVNAGDFPAAAGHYLGVEIDNASTSSGSWMAVDNVRLAYVICETATNPLPSNNAANVDITTATLSWNVGVDPNNPTIVNPNITKHYVYISKQGANSYGDPNLSSIAPIEVLADGSAAASCALPFTLKNDETYYWRVDESVNNSGPSDPATIIGSVWTFATPHGSRTIIYKEDFNGPVGGVLNGLIPDIAPPGAKWTAADILKADGTSGTAVGTASAFLPFVPQDGYIYTASLTVDVIGGGSSDFSAFGFCNGNSSPTTRFMSGNTAVYWILSRPSDATSGYDQTFTGTGTSGSQDIRVSTCGFDSRSADNLKIVLDTTNATWVAKWYVDDKLARTVNVTESHKPNFRYIAFSNYRTYSILGSLTLEGLRLVEAAHNPTPADNAVDIATSATLNWSVGVDPDNTAVPNPAITRHYVYMVETERDFTGDPNFLGLTPYTVIADGSATASCNPPITLKTDKAYYWRVDECLNDAAPSDPNGVLTGQVWKFMTIQAIPVFTQHPTGVVTTPGQTVQLNVVVESLSPVTYVWYKTLDAVTTTPGDDVVVTDTDELPATLTLSNVVGSDNEGYYYCKATNLSLIPMYSNVATVEINRKVAHWMLDSVVDDQYPDSSADAHHAVPTGTPTFVVGAGATTDMGVQISAADGYASAGTWNPSAYTGRLTISLWAKWNGQPLPAALQGLLAKRNSAVAGNLMWQVSIGSSDNKVYFKNASYSVAGNVMPTNEWTQIAVVFNGTTATIYSNGVNVGNGVITLDSKTDANLVIGALEEAAGAATSPFNGAMDDIQIFNYVLDNHQIADVYHHVTDKQVCIDTYAGTYDLNADCVVDIDDLMLILANWLDDGYYPN